MFYQKIRILIIIFVCTPVFIQSQTSIKVNAITTLAAVPNLGVEFNIGEKTTFQVDMAASFWTINGKPYKFGMLFPEFRYYTREAGYGFFVGGHVGGGKFKLQKGQYSSTDYYQEGYTLLFGVTTGYQWRLNDRFNLELFVGGGSSQASYKGYSLETGERLDGAENYNKSGEFLPYRGGLMVVYKLK
ncbi:DUF3575 domain-containing protein [Seonamhaeicola sp. MEBiC1930]|uniref:DUF3575 domain-containing protein n=1 Tax=Seonamhaeicola sp. MEBiC01930 TaxID=2976768 RepID=UPI00324AB9A1